MYKKGKITWLVLISTLTFVMQHGLMEKANFHQTIERLSFQFEVHRYDKYDLGGAS